MARAHPKRSRRIEERRGNRPTPYPSRRWASRFATEPPWVASTHLRPGHRTRYLAGCCPFLRTTVWRADEALEIESPAQPRRVSPRTLRVLLTALLVISACLFAIGVAIERNSKHGAHGE